MLEERLAAQLAARELDTRTLASAWCSRWPHPVATADATEAIAGMLDGDAGGVRFFFSDVRRAELLLELLGVQGALRADFRAMAQDALATSPDRRRLQRLLPMTLEEASEPVLWALTARARTHPITDRALLVGDTVHVINPSSPIPDDPQIMVHRVALLGSPLARLQQALDAQGEQALCADRQLDGLLARLAEDDRDLPALQHARATLLHNDMVRPGRPALNPSWREGLVVLLAEPPPAARLRLRLSAPLCAPEQYDSSRHWRSPFLAHSAEGPLPENKPPSTVMDRLPRCGPVDLGREESASVVRFGPHGQTAEADRHFIPWGEVDELLWQRARKRQLGPRDRLPAIQGMATWFAHPVDIPAATWETADRLLAAAWLALRRGLGGSESLVMHDRAVFVDCGACCATLRLHDGADGPVRAAIAGEVIVAPQTVTVKNRWGRLESVERERHIVTADSLHRGGLPSGVHLWGAGWELQARFERSPLLNRYA